MTMPDSDAGASEALGLENAQDYLDRLIRELHNMDTRKKQPLVLVLELLSRHMKVTRREIGALKPGGGLSSTAVDLEEIVSETARAANEFMNAAELVESVAAGVDADSGARLMQAVTRIYEASAFQDITGQRITKALRALADIEEKIQALANACEVFGSSDSEDEPAAIGDEALLNGPQLGSNAYSQSDIDALFESLGSAP
jgi:chemotaxis protein CheZ